MNCCGGHVEEILNQEGAVVAKFCRRCRSRFVIAMCDYCSKHFDRNIDKRGGCYCSEGCKKKAARAREQERAIEKANEAMKQ